MLGGVFKLTLFLNVFFLFIIFIWQAATANASPIMEINDNLARSIDRVPYFSINNNHRGAPLVIRSLHSTVDQQSLIDSSPSRSRFRSRHRHLRKKIPSTKLKNSPNIFQSTGTYNKNSRPSKRIHVVLDDRLKRFRMLDPDEFQEMLSSISQHIPDEQSKGQNGIDTIGGMQIENYWSRK